MSLRALVVFMLAAVLAAEAATVADRSATLQRAGPSIRVLLSDGGISGEGIHLSRTGDRLRGAIFSEVAELQIGEAQLQGTLGGRAVKVALSRDGEGLAASGTWAGMPLAIWFNPHAVRASVGSCAYELARSGDDYEGSSSCTGAPAPTRLHLPASFREEDPADQLVALAILLGSNVGAYEVTGPMPPTPPQP